jgi:RNA polymerase sigma factor (sigma-70 family)
MEASSLIAVSTVQDETVFEPAPASFSRPTETKAVADHLKLVQKYAAKFAPRESALHDDLVQEGLIAVTKAARKWTPEGGASFTTYAMNKARRAIERAFGRQGTVVCRSNKDRETGGNYELPGAVWMDAPIALHQGERDANAHEFALDDRLSSAPTQEAAAIAAERSAIVRKVIATLPKKKAAIFSAVVVDGGDLRSVAAASGCCFSRVKQIVDECMPILRRRLQKELTDAC